MMPVAATSADAMPAPARSNARARAAVPTSRRHGQATAGPEPEKARGNDLSNSQTATVKPSPITPIQQYSSPCSFIERGPYRFFRSPTLGVFASWWWDSF